MRSTETEYDVVVVGAGLGGLAAAIFLARAGRKVLLVERSKHFGGRARTEFADGFSFNLGPHAIYHKGAASRLMAELGVTPLGGTPRVSGSHAVANGVKHTFPAGTLSMLTTGLLDLPAKLEAIRLLVALPKMDARAAASLTVADWVERNVSHPSVKAFFHAVFRLATYTDAPDLLSAGAALSQLQSAISANVLYIDGGWQTLVDALIRISDQTGVKRMNGARVQAIEINSTEPAKRVLLSDGRSHRAAQVVIAASPADAAALVPASAPLAAWARDAVPVKAASLDVALSRLPRPKSTFGLGIDRPFYLSVHSAVARLAPNGGALIHVAKYLSVSGPDSSASEDEMEGFLEMIQPGWRSVLVRKRFLPDLTVYNAIPLASRGGIEGRPGPAVPDAPGLYIAGDWVGGQGLLADATLASAKAAADAILAYPERAVGDRPAAAFGGEQPAVAGGGFSYDTAGNFRRTPSRIDRPLNSPSWIRSSRRAGRLHRQRLVGRALKE